MNQLWSTDEIESIVLLSSAVTAIAGTELRVATTNLLQAVREGRLAADLEIMRRLTDQVHQPKAGAIRTAGVGKILSRTRTSCGNDSETAFKRLYKAILPKGRAVDALESALHQFCEHVSAADSNDAANARHLSTLFDPVASEAVQHLRSQAQSLEQLLDPYLRTQELYLYLKSVIENTTRNTASGSTYYAG